jgi:alpha-soluble NSF attachment protein
MDGSFATTRECLLLEALSGSFAAQDQEAYTNAISEYDRMTKLDDWKTTLLLRVKTSIEKAEDGDEDYT